MYSMKSTSEDNKMLKKLYSKFELKSYLLNDLTLDHKLFLSAILRTSSWQKDDSFILFGEDFPVHTLYFNNVFKDIFLNAQLVFLSKNAIKEIIMSDDEENFSFSKNIENFSLNIDLSGEDTLNELKFPTPSVFLRDREYCERMWKHIAFDHILLHAKIQLMSLRCYKEIPERFKHLMNVYQNVYSTNEIYALIDLSIHAASWESIRDNNIKLLMDYFINKCIEYGSEFVDDKHFLEKFIPEEDYPKTSVLAKIFFDEILKIREKAFEIVPTKDEILSP
ncbi:hypothetical protein [Saliterribacillus persicus]|uniref:Uncharacterized protein n=1 Tax=Saliterribacillus persicus TaxID=930114 RepID=A0A368X8W4_9BACI|nr:hypothetical protein [Saliterribacillus persicus]RCW62877.1 hypothetical protein DFR57_12246 [Saliterribacillus persicus]